MYSYMLGTGTRQGPVGVYFSDEPNHYPSQNIPLDTSILSIGPTLCSVYPLDPSFAHVHHSIISLVHPLMAIKLANASGPLVTSSVYSSITDTTATIVDSSVLDTGSWRLARKFYGKGAIE